MRTLDKSELAQVSGAGLLGLGLGLNLLNLVGVGAKVTVGGDDHGSRGRNRGYERCERGNRGHRNRCW